MLSGVGIDISSASGECFIAIDRPDIVLKFFA
jgi:hypothetical protein